MTIYDQIRYEKLPYEINREAASYIEKLIYMSKQINIIGGNILPPDQSRIIEKAKFTYFLLGKAFEKQVKAVGNQGRS